MFKDTQALFAKLKQSSGILFISLEILTVKPFKNRIVSI